MLSDRARWLVVTACVVTALVTWIGMDSLWDYGDYANRQLDGYWFRNGLPLSVVVVLAAAYAPPWRLPRFVRVAVLLPFVHLFAIVVVAQLVEVINTGIRGFLYPHDAEYVAVPSVAYVAIAGAVLVITALVIKRRHGEWAHAS